MLVQLPSKLRVYLQNHIFIIVFVKLSEVNIMRKIKIKQISMAYNDEYTTTSLSNILMSSCSIRGMFFFFIEQVWSIAPAKKAIHMKNAHLFNFAKDLQKCSTPQFDLRWLPDNLTLYSWTHIVVGWPRSSATVINSKKKIFYLYRNSKELIYIDYMVFKL